MLRTSVKIIDGEEFIVYTIKATRPVDVSAWRSAMETLGYQLNDYIHWRNWEEQTGIPYTKLEELYSLLVNYI